MNKDDDSILGKYLETTEGSYYNPGDMRHDVKLLLDIADTIGDSKFILVAYAKVKSVTDSWVTALGLNSINRTEQEQAKSKLKAIENSFEPNKEDGLVLKQLIYELLKLKKRCKYDLKHWDIMKQPSRPWVE